MAFYFDIKNMLNSYTPVLKSGAFIPFVGPYYKYRTWQDMYMSPWSSQANCDSAVLKRISVVPMYVILFFISGQLFPLEVVKGKKTYSLWSSL